MKWFVGINTVEELRRKYRELLKKYHPDKAGGNLEITQEINDEYDRMYALLKDKHEGEDTGKAYDEDEINEQIKAILQKIAHYDIDIEIIGKWIWCFQAYEYRKQLKELGFKWAAKKKAWIWHDGNYSRNHKGETDLNDIRIKYGVREVKLRQGKRAIKG